MGLIAAIKFFDFIIKELRARNTNRTTCSTTRKTNQRNECKL